MSRRARTWLGCAAAAALIAALGFGTNWRLAFVAAMAAGAIALTRLRYAPAVAVALLAITAAFAQTGHSAGSDHRHVTPAHSAGP
ncbi:MAG: hypothetical protein QOJ85_3750 [Solirubrobacteraceae bacterium]|jgi:uncharacterized membrane protein YedE/YeeE|nr:hypothetical protein [Solirubrobacteraceae bacterium]